MLPPEIKDINETYFNASNFESLMRGIHFAVYMMALSKIFTGPDCARRFRLRMTIIITLLFLMSTIRFGAFWAYVRRAFIAYGETGESTASALSSYPIWFTGTTSVSYANAILADCLIIWRCWIVWGRSWQVTVIPIICTILSAVFSALAIYQTITPNAFGDVRSDYVAALYSTSLVITLYCTGMIVFQIVRIGVRSKASYGLRSYRGVIEIIAESSALYCIATFFAMIAYFSNEHVFEFALIFWSSMIGIAPTLLIARVAAGEARPETTWDDFEDSRQGPTTSFFRFNGPSEMAAGDVTHTGSNHTIVNDVQTIEAEPLETIDNYRMKENTSIA